MLGAAPELEQAIPNIGINAAEGRQVSAGIDILQTRRAAGKLGTVVLIHLGNNGTFTAKQFDQMMQVLAGVKRVVFVDVKVPRSWIGPNNTVLADGVKRYPNAVLVDWLAVSYNRPELFWSDGIHLRPEGARIYADLIATAIKAP
jgi:lysophospholipase L1-like esterase